MPVWWNLIQKAARGSWRVAWVEETGTGPPYPCPVPWPGHFFICILCNHLQFREPLEQTHCTEGGAVGTLAFSPSIRSTGNAIWGVGLASEWGASWWQSTPSASLGGRGQKWSRSQDAQRLPACGEAKSSRSTRSQTSFVFITVVQEKKNGVRIGHAVDTALIPPLAFPLSFSPWSFPEAADCTTAMY